MSAAPDAAKPTDTAATQAGASQPVAEPGNITTDSGKVPRPTLAKDSTSDAAKATAALKLADQGTVRLRIDPWGEVFVNGRTVGVSPPLKQVKLAPGTYKIEVRNGTLPSFVTNIEIKAKEEIGVRHKFQ